MATKPIYTLQAGRAFAAIVVVLFHTNTILGLPKYLNRPVLPFFQAGNSGVQFFFVLSGFVILLAHQRDINKSANLRSFVWKRFRRLYPALWAALLFVIPIYFAIPSFGIGGERGIANIASAFLITPTSREYLLSIEWTLRHEVLFYVVFGVMIWRRSIGFALAAAWFMASAIVPWLLPQYPFSFFFASNHLLFGFGMLACLVYELGTTRRLTALSTTGFGALVFAASWMMRVQDPLQHSSGLDLSFGVGATALIFGLAVLERDMGLKVPRLLVFLGEASYSIYLVHYPVISVASKLSKIAQQHVPDVGIFLITATAGLVGGTAFHLTVEKPLLRVFIRQPKVDALAIT